MHAWNAHVTNPRKVAIDRQLLRSNQLFHVANWALLRSSYLLTDAVFPLQSHTLRTLTIHGMRNKSHNIAI